MNHPPSKLSSSSPLSPSPHPMIRPAGNIAHRRLLTPSPPPPPPPHSSSWSSLSPLAPPFTVDRPLAPAANPSAPPPATAGNLPPPRAAAEPHPTLTWAPPSARSRSIPSSSAIEAPPYYPFYASVVGGKHAAVDQALGALHDHEGFVGMEAEHWDLEFDRGEGEREAGIDMGSSWIDPSFAYPAPIFHKGNASESFVSCEDSWGPWHGKLGSTAKKVQSGSECSQLIDRKHSATSEENVRVPCKKSGTAVLGTDVLHKGSAYFHSQDPILNMEDCNAYNSNFPYDRYMAQLISCSADPMSYYPDKYCSPQSYASLAKKSSSSMDQTMPGNTYTTIQHEDSSKGNENCVGYALAKKNELIINHKAQNSECKEVHMEKSIASNNLKDNNRPVDCLLTKKGLSLSNELTTGNSMDSSTEVKSGSYIAHLNLPKSFTSRSSPAKPGDSAQTSLETLDELDLSEDSPCWKGTLSSRQCPFGVNETIDPYSLLSDSKGCGNSFQSVEHLSVTAAFSALSSLDQDGSLIHIESRDTPNLSLMRESFPVVSFLGKDEKFQNSDEKGLDCAKVSYEGSLSSYVPGGQSSEVNQLKDAERRKCIVKILGHEEDVFVGQTVYTGESNMETGSKGFGRDSSSICGPSASEQAMNAISGGVIASDIVEPLGSSDHGGKCSPYGGNVGVIVKAMHGLSETLMCLYNNDANELKEHEHELVHQVIDNLKALVLKNKKSSAVEIHGIVGIIDNTQLNTSGIAFGVPDASTNRGSNETGQGIKVKTEFSGSAACVDKFRNTVSGRSSGVTKILEKALEETIHEQEENPQILLYKNLWIEAEAANCSLKYELQLSRLMLGMENQKSQTVGNPHEPKNTNDGSPVEHQDPEIDASVMARFRVLKGRREGSSSTGEEHRVLDPVDGSNTRSVNSMLTGRNPRPSAAEAESRGRISIEKIWSDQYFSSNSEENASSNWSNAPNRKGKHVLSCGSSEWEHVMEDDFPWYKNPRS